MDGTNRCAWPYGRAALLSAGCFSQLVLATFLVAFAWPQAPAAAKTPGSTYCFYKTCHRVKTLNETRALIGKSVTLNASHYDDCRKDPYNPCGLTSSGEPFYPHRPDNAASPIYPDGTILLVRNPVTQESAIIRINNAGPYWGNRKLDVSKATAKKLGFARRGVAKLETKILAAPNKQDARYRKNRTYKRVPGYIGKHNSLKTAFETSAALMAVEAIAGSIQAPSSGVVVAASNHEADSVEAVRTKLLAQVREINKAIKTVETMPKVALNSVTAPDTEIRPVRIAGYITNLTNSDPLAAKQSRTKYRNNIASRLSPIANRRNTKTKQAETTIAQTIHLPTARTAVRLIQSAEFNGKNLAISPKELFLDFATNNLKRMIRATRLQISSSPWPGKIPEPPSLSRFLWLSRSAFL